ncbi:MAG: hypothetical protein ABJC66_10565 [Gammaproteobacteria bacterium]
MTWRVALIDSCGSWPGVADAAAFGDDGGRVAQRETVADPTGHGSRVARLLTAVEGAVELLLGQVFLDARPASAAAVAAAIDWAVAARANLIHMSLGLGADRAVLADAVGRAVVEGCLMVAAVPARGGLVYPAGYPGVIRATGDARCAPGELSHLGEWLYGGCPCFEAATRDEAASGNSRTAAAGGASVGAAWVTRGILQGPRPATALAAVSALSAMARYVGPERREREPSS